MALDATTGGNSYVDVAYADAYFADGLQVSEWNAISSKEAALVDSSEWLSVLGLNEDGVSIEIGGDIPSAVQKACCLLAIFVNENSGSLNSADLTTRIKVSVIELEQEVAEFGTVASLPMRVKALLQPYLGDYGGGFTLNTYI